MRKALIVGIDHYPHIGDLGGCVNDALNVKSVIERNADGTTNFPTPRLLLGSSKQPALRKQLKAAIAELFMDPSDVAFFYFAGHGFVVETGGVMCTSDCTEGDDGVAFSDLMALADRSKARNKVIVLDCCFAGDLSSRATDRAAAEVRDGTTILTAAKSYQPSAEIAGSGVFTTLFVDALNGAAANLLGDVTPGSVYAHIDQSLGTWEQRPVFKTNVENFISLRKANAPISLADLHQITEFFPSADFIFPLDPAFEPVRSRDESENASIPAPDPIKVAKFRVLQRYRAVNLLRPIGTDHMWNAAMENGACELTVLGEHYHRLVSKGLI